MFDVDSFYSKINSLKFQNKRLYSNCFLSFDDIKNIAGKSDSFFYTFEKSTFLFNYEDDFYRMYFYIVDLEQFKNIKVHLESIKSPVLVEILGKRNQIENLQSSLVDIGFCIYDILSQWRSNKIICDNFVKNYKNIRYQRALLEDAKEIDNLLTDSFDKYVSHLPSIQQIQNLIDKGQVYLAKEEDNIASIILLESIGKFGKYLYQIATHEKYKGKNIGWNLAKFAYSHYKDNNNFTSWVQDDNEASVYLHSKLGMLKSDLKTIVLIYKKGESIGKNI